MSHQATTYALDVCMNDAKMSKPARAVLLALAARANHRNGISYGGDWLALTGYTSSPVRHALRDLVSAGHIGVLQRRSGRATIYRFPVVSQLSTTRLPAAGSEPDIEHPRGSQQPRPGSQQPRPGSQQPRTDISTGGIYRAPPGRTDSQGAFHPEYCECEECNQLRVAQ